MFINDLFKEGKIINDEKFFLPTNIGNNVIIGSNATILPVNICSDAVIGAGSVVTKDIDVKGTYVGNPARLLRKF
jgi:acetyltransferase-like isoleucine patch superfamily enzyme